MNVALLGTGLLGEAVAERLHAAGYSLSVYNRSVGKTRALQQRGVEVAATAAAALSKADVVLLLLADAAAIRAVLFDPSTSAAINGRMVIQMGTVGPSESRSIDAEITRLGGRYLEAPVLGSITEAKAGTLLIMVGGTPENLTDWTPLLQVLGSDVRLIGPVGKAAVMKLALNQLIAAEMAAFALSLGLIRESGVDRDTFMEILRKSALYAPMFDKKLPRLAERQYAQPNFSTRHLLKDVDLCLTAAEQAGLSTEGLQGVRSLLTDTLARGLGEVDYSSLYERVDPAEGRNR
ncbi:MAG: NAD-binding protein [Nitrospira sp. CR2.1]|nr:NAD-binding protein [Nitrospira sp. CR2.1]MBA5876293.1 NAD-binding protein [Nitrospira sp. CR1.2]